ncbi:MAG: class I SAM-dependent methyltransferase [Betaproteobacteria bacterium]|nr:class I SAM-dependent methyltransferase [Betaproteobacteria bacterium]MBV9361619.1 class I SAM-dependent methyltransferase [Betaproteobacteria bacterium]
MNLADVTHYYSERLREHGASAQGVDWNSADSQRLRFTQLLRICGERENFSLNDIGCGYGALFDYLSERRSHCDYLGVDIAAPMIAKAVELHRGRTGCRFLVGEHPDRRADYGVASGVFNVKLSSHAADWRAHILRTLDHLNEASKDGFAFNCLTKYSDADRMKEHLYYADPAELFDHCKRSYSRNVALLHDYGLYEFTILVRKDIAA